MSGETTRIGCAHAYACLCSQKSNGAVPHFSVQELEALYRRLDRMDEDAKRQRHVEVAMKLIASWREIDIPSLTLPQGEEWSVSS
jgi:hypothetical protein